MTTTDQQGEQALDELGENEPGSAVEELQACIDEAVASGTPVTVGKGVYALYATPEGGLHLSYRPEGSTEDGHFPVPPGLLRMAMAKGDGMGALAQMRALFGQLG